MASASPRVSAGGRWMVYALLVAFALFFLTPLVVVVLNSLRTAEEIGRGSVIGWPAHARSRLKRSLSCKRSAERPKS